jgi:AraC family transcriptional regulator of adaptative response / DNA-3-methyladenine glycosylase II
VPLNPWIADFLADRCVAGVEDLDEHGYRRALRLAHGCGVLELADMVVWHGDPRDAAAAADVAARITDADADTAAIDAHLARDPLLAPAVAAQPGIRVPGAADGFEIAVRAVIGQQVSVAAARTIAGRLAAAYGEPLPRPAGSVVRCFPSPAALAAADRSSLPMPGARAAALLGLAAAVRDGVPAEPDALAGLRGFGPWTVAYVAMRLGDADAFPAGDLGLRHAALRLGLPDDRRALEQRAERWRPYRAYAVQYLWSTL